MPAELMALDITEQAAARPRAGRFRRSSSSTRRSTPWTARASSTCSSTSSSRRRGRRRGPRWVTGRWPGCRSCSKTSANPTRGPRSGWVRGPCATTWPPSRPGACERYRAAGLIICGRTNTPEFGNHCATEPALFGPTLNPWRRDVSPGGSSGGSAAAVAARLIGAASGGDGTGSIRMPASCCGLVGLKPRRGRSSWAPGGRAGSGRPRAQARTDPHRPRQCAAARCGHRHGAGRSVHGAAARAAVRRRGRRRSRAVRVLAATHPPFPGTVDARVQAVADQAAQVLEGLGHAVRRARSRSTPRRSATRSR